MAFSRSPLLTGLRSKGKLIVAKLSIDTGYARSKIALSTAMATVMLDRYLLRYFLAVVDHGNFSRAASHCNVSQPTLSIGIAKLERELGTPLFVRSNQRVELTGGGTRFLTHARRIEREFNLALQSLAQDKGLPSLRLGVLSTVPGAVIADAVVAARPEHQHKLEIVYGNERELSGHLTRGRMDIALTIVGRGENQFREKPICTEGYGLALAKTHALAGLTEISAEQLENEVMIVRRHCEMLPQTSRFFTKRGIRPHFALKSTNDERVVQMVAAGLGITVMPNCYVADGLARAKLTAFDLTRTLGWAATQEAESLITSPLPLLTTIAERLRG